MLEKGKASKVQGLGPSPGPVFLVLGLAMVLLCSASV